jgi:phosphoglycolate phosphatase-like HAD superfamily hydrolase
MIAPDARRVLLFDIDGTLLWTDGAGRRSMEHALTTVFGVHGDPSYRYDGKTDRQITREQMRHAGIDDATIDARIDAVFALYLERLDAELSANAEHARLCAGVPALLERLSSVPHVTLGLLTGNIREGAARKLAAVGVDFAQFAVGAFGCDHEERPMLPSVARQRAMALLGHDLTGEQFVIIGDTPADLQCGRGIGGRAFGVATGRYSVSELAAYDPVGVFSTFQDTDAVVEALIQ